MKISLFGKEVFSFSKNQSSKSLISFDDAIRLILDGGGDQGIGISKAYPNHLWVYVAVNAISRNISRVPFKLFNEADREILSGPVYRLFNTISPILDQSKLWEGTQIFKQIRGEAFWHLIDGISGPSEIEFLEPGSMKEKIIDGEIAGWEYTKQGKRIQLDITEIIHFRYFNPFNMFRGLNPLIATLQTIKTDDASRSFNKEVLRNGSFPGSVLETEKNLNDIQYNRILKSFEKRHQSANKAGKVAILEGGLKYREIRLTATDLDLVNQKKLNKEEILAAYNVPLAAAGDISSFNRANLKTALKQFWEQTLIPELHSMQSNIQTNLLDIHFRGVKGKFDLTGIAELQEELTEQIDRATKLFNMGIPFVDINERLNLGFNTDNKPWLQNGYLPLNLIPANESRAVDPGSAMVNGFERFIKNINTKEKKNELANQRKWEKLIRQIIPIERKYSNKLGEWIFSVRQEILNNFFTIAGAEGSYTKLKKHLEGSNLKLIEEKITDLEANQPLFNEEEYLRLLKELSLPFITDAIEIGGNTAFEEIALDESFNIASAETIAAIETRANKLKDITDNLRGATRSVLIEGVASGSSNNEIADSLRSFLNQYKSRSRVVARTEINGAANEGKTIANKEAGIEKHTWFTSQDSRVRDSHANVNGETVRIGDKFSNGLRYPGDKEGSASNVINCRCTTIAEV